MRKAQEKTNFLQNEMILFFSFPLPTGPANAERHRVSLTEVAGRCPRKFTDRKPSIFIRIASSSDLFSILQPRFFLHQQPVWGSGELQLTNLSRVQAPWGLRFSAGKTFSQQVPYFLDLTRNGQVRGSCAEYLCYAKG